MNYRKFIVKDDVLLKYNGTDKTVNVPIEVKILGDNCFNGNKHIKKVILPPSVKEIGISTFENCENLEEINLENIEKFEYSSFSGCKNIKEINLEKAKEIYEYAFYNCQSLEKVYLYNGLEKMENNVFTNTKIKEITLPKTLSKIDMPFYDCIELKTITLNRKYHVSDISLICGCGNINLTKVEGPEITCEDNVVYNKDKTVLISYLESKKDKCFKVPDSVCEIYDDAIMKNKYLKELIFGENLQQVNVYAIYENTIEKIIGNKKLSELMTSSISCDNALIDLKRTKLEIFEQSSIEENSSCKILLPNTIKTIYTKRSNGKQELVLPNSKKNKIKIYGDGNIGNITFEKNLEELLNEGKSFREASQIIKNQER